MKNLRPLYRGAVKAVLCILMLMVFRSANAQSYYPAGLGNGNMQLWLTGSDPTTFLTSTGTQVASGGSVATWTDKSGKGLSATQATAAKQPVYMSNQQNGFGAMIFQNNTQYMTGSTGSWRTVVSTRAYLGTSYQYLFSAPALTDFSVRFSGGSTSVSYTDGPNTNDWDYNTGAVPTQWINGVQSLTGTTITHILVDEAASNTIGTYSLSNTFLNRGMYNNDPVYELIVYNSVLTTTQRKLLENYQASEWGLASVLPASYSIFTPPTPSTWNRNLVGIGYTSSSDYFLTDASGSTDGLGFQSASTATDFLNIAGYIMAAHNGQANTTLYNQTLPNVPALTYMWNRSWYIEQFNGNSTGNVTLNFNFPDYNGGAPNSGYHFGILYNATDGTFATGTNKQITYVSYAVSATIVAFKVNVANLPAGYYTIIWNFNNVLPVTLENFTVTKQSADAAIAKWTMGPSFGQGTFAVQRSADGAQFNTIGTVAATGNDALGQSYSYIDHSPLTGVNYYRLMMTDNFGNASYSPIDILDFNPTTGSIALYPVPASDMLHISAPGISGGGNILLFSTSGQLLASYQLSLVDGASVSIGTLPPGAYFAQIKMAGQSRVLSFVKR
jgi:hypothetical protein